MKTNVYSMVSPRTGAPVANQFIIIEGNKKYFTSYNTIIACEHKGKITLDRNSWDYSRTTLKYLGVFLDGKNKAEIQRLINDGTYKLANLN